MGMCFAVSLSSFQMAAVASRPFITGICMSIRIASNSSGAACSIRCKQSCPFTVRTQCTL